MRLIRVGALLATLTLGLGTLAACGDDTPAPTPTQTVSFAAGTTMAALNQAQRLRVGTKFDQPGFGLLGLDGKPAGFDVEIAQIIAKKLGIPEEKIEYTEAPSRLRETLIEEGTVDIVVATYTINDTRKERIDFAGPYYVAGQQIMTRKGDTSITRPEDFQAGDKKVCTVTGSTPAANIVNYLADEATQLVLFDTYDKCLEPLRDGTVDAVTTDNVILLGYISRSPNDFQLVGTKFTVEPYGIGLKKGDDVFRDFINDVLEEAAANGDYAAAWSSTAGSFDPVIPDMPEVNRY